MNKCPNGVNKMNGITILSENDVYSVIGRQKKEQLPGGCSFEISGKGKKFYSWLRIARALSAHTGVQCVIRYCCRAGLAFSG